MGKELSAGNSDARFGKALRGATAQSALTIVASMVSDPAVQLFAQLVPHAWSVVHTVLDSAISRPEASREQWRLQKVTEHVVGRLMMRHEAGERLRKDGFFTGGESRAKGEALFEAVLRASLHQFEEDKLQYIANIYVNACFLNTTPDSVNSVLHQADDKTWRHFCVIAILASAKWRDVLAHFNELPRARFDEASEAALLRDDLDRLHGRASGLLEGDAGAVRLTPSGQLFARLTELDTMPEENHAPLRATMLSELQRVVP